MSNPIIPANTPLERARASLTNAVSYLSRFSFVKGLVTEGDTRLDFFIYFSDADARSYDPDSADGIHFVGLDLDLLVGAICEEVAPEFAASLLRPPSTSPQFNYIIQIDPLPVPEVATEETQTPTAEYTEASIPPDDGLSLFEAEKLAQGEGMHE